MKKLLLALTALLAGSFLFAQTDEEVDRKVDAIIAQMTLEEKVGMCSGDPSAMGFKGIPRLGIPNVQCCDGPKGPNAASGTTAFPTGILWGSTWDPEVIERAGKVIGNETRALGRGVILGPGVNINRDPLGGRFFEYFTEDPYLNSVIAVADVKGIQSEGVSACAKHYACNNREDNRNFYMSVVDDRTLNEIYLPVFKALVQDARIGTVMTSANGINYEFVSDSRKMMTDILVNRWGFRGFSMTDWLQARSTEKSAFAGLDVSMPGGDNCAFGTALLEAVKAGKVTEAAIDEKVRHILRVYDMIGVLDGRNLQEGAQVGGEEHHQTALDVAREGIVLLKNENKSLPLNPKKVRNVLVTGPNADRKFCLWAMGGSSWVQAPYEVTVLQGIKDAIGDAKVNYISTDGLGGYKVVPAEATQEGGFTASYYGKGPDPVVTKKVDEVNFMWEMRSPDPSIKVEDFREARFDAHIVAPVDGIYTLRFFVGGGSAMIFNNEWGGAPIAVSRSDQDGGYSVATIELKKGQSYHPCMIYSHGQGDAAVRIEWETPQTQHSSRKLKELKKAARKADAVIFVAGIDYSLDTEGHDKEGISFPNVQENLINTLSEETKNLCVVLMNGSPLELGGWIDNAESVVEAFYPGMLGGQAVSEVLFGKLNPSGRLSFTWPKKLSDVPSKKLCYEDHDVIVYSDSLMVGYRYFDTKDVEPQFAFGYGLSYVDFEYSGLKVRQDGDKVTATVKVKNNGKMDGKEVVQLYVRPVNPSVSRPVHELKGFSKVFLKAGESKTVTIELDESAFSYFDVTRNDWKVDRCDYEIEIGRNSRDIVLHKPLTLK